MTLNKVINTTILSTVIGLNGLVGNLTPAYAQTPAKQEQTKPAITNEEIEQLMKKKTVEEILEGAPVEYVKYDKEKGRTNFDELLSDPSAYAKFVFFYSSDLSYRNYFIDKYAAICFLEAFKTRPNLVKGILFPDQVNPSLARDNYQGLKEKFGLLGGPSFALFIPAHGKSVKYDSFFGGPENNREVPVVKTMLIKWIDIAMDQTNPDFRKFKYQNTLTLKPSD